MFFPLFAYTSIVTFTTVVQCFETVKKKKKLGEKREKEKRRKGEDKKREKETIRKEGKKRMRQRKG